MRFETPLVDAYLTSLTEVEAEHISAIDAMELERERGSVSPKIAERLNFPTHGVGRRLQAWETLSVRMAAEWPPYGYYIVDEYVNDLEIRDALEVVRANLGDSGDRMSGLLERLDGKFRELTVDDGGNSILWYVRESSDDLRRRPWWWRRTPRNLPWEAAGSRPDDNGQQADDH